MYGLRTVDNVLPCVQLTDDVILSTAGAVQRFIDSCTDGILQVNDRSDIVAIESIVSTVDIHVDVFASTVDNTAGIEDTCPTCPPNISPRQCCGRGQCSNSTCQCNEGWCN